MFRILLDHNVPATLRKHLSKHEVRTAAEEGWGQISNGVLISRAEAAGFQVLLTCDQNIKYQQNLSKRVISLVVLGSNIWPSVQPHLAEIAKAVDRAVPNSFEFMEITPLPRRRRMQGPPI
jgi:hypothetical protein